MAIQTGSNISKNGLIFHYDMHNRTSWKGKPTTNLCYHRNSIKGSRSDFAYNEHSTDATFNKNHPGRVSCLTPTGGAITTMVNSGVNSGNWQVTHHGYWMYDEELQRAVCVMNDIDGQWKAHSFGTGYSLNSLGWTGGETYSISWDGWTSRIDKTAACGIYYRRASDNVRNFYAGNAYSSPNGKNTETHKWQRLWATFTVPAGMDLTYGLGMYCYGHHTGRGTIKMANLQWEEGTPSHFVTDANGNPAETRSNTEALIDIAGGNTITPNNLTYNADQTFSFNGSSSDLSVPDAPSLNPEYVTVECWVKFNNTSHARALVAKRTATNAGSYWLYISATNSLLWDTYQGSVQNRQTVNYPFAADQWYHITTTYGATYKKVYVNGVEVGSTSGGAATTSNSSVLMIGDCPISEYRLNGDQPMTKIYNRYLEPEEVKQNFNATRGRYGV